MSTTTIAEVLSKYLPPATVEICSKWIIQKNIHLKITRGRASKYGDYRPLGYDQGHRITVNHDLNPYAFLITFVHEVAHLNCHINFGNRHDPHGKEWKREFGSLLYDFLNRDIFPTEIENALAQYMRNPAATSCSDVQLSKALKKHDPVQGENIVHLDELTEDTIFRLHQSLPGMIFKKGKRLRTRFHCVEINTNKIYFIGGLAEVVIQESLKFKV